MIGPPGWLRRRAPDAPAVVALLAGFAVLFRDALFRGSFAIIGDPLRQLYPLRTIAWQMIREGTPPLWTPQLLSGYPLSAMVMLGIGYPVTWGYAFLPGYWAEQVYVLAPYLLGPLFTYAFLRELGRSPAGALLGGLTFGFGGFLFSTIGLTGVHANSALWMPLLLLGVARARRSGFVASLLVATLAFTMSVVAGSGQIFLYAGALGVVYALCLAVVPDEPRFRWRPLFVAGGSILLGAGLTAWQIAETWTATGLSVRRAYPAERFAEGSFTPEFAWQALIQPLGNYWDSSTFVPAIALLLAIVAVAAALRSPRRSAQTFFWLLIAIGAALLIFGSHTPLFAVYSRIPFVSRFRYPSRHTLEWSFAIAVLAAQGWDLVSAWVGSWNVRLKGSVALGVVALGLAGFVSHRWLQLNIADGLERITDLNRTSHGSSAGYVGYKLAFTAIVAFAAAMLARTRDSWLRTSLLSVAFTFACLVEPFFWLVRPVIRTSSVPVSQFTATAGSTQIIRDVLGPHEPLYRERVYSAAHPYAVSPGEGLEAPNWTVLAGFHEANGYESLISERYSRAMRGVVDAEPFVYPDPSLIDDRSHVLDLLNVRFVTSFSDFAASPGSGGVAKEGVVFSWGDLALDLPRDERVELFARGVEADQLVVVTTMANAAAVRHGVEVASAIVHLSDGGTIVRPIRAGVETAEWAHDRADVRAIVQHQRAPVFDSAPGDAEGSFQSMRFIGRIPLGERVRVERVEFARLIEGASVGLWKASLLDSKSGASRMLPQPSAKRWRTVYDENGIMILENRRLLPRAWLVPNVEVSAADEILRRIREGGDAFDPKQTALVEPGSRVPAWSRNTLAPGSFAQIVAYEPNRLRIATDSAEAAYLVVSELHYPGWVATVDGVDTPVERTNYLLRGLPLPAGRHVVEMRYTAPAARRGAVVTLGTVLLISALIWIVRRRPSPVSSGR